jgi:hypothetical protein
MPSEHSPVLVGADRLAVSDHAATPPGAPATEGPQLPNWSRPHQGRMLALRSVTDRDPQSHDDQYPDRVDAAGTVLHGAHRARRRWPEARVTICRAHRGGRFDTSTKTIVPSPLSPSSTLPPRQYHNAYHSSTSHGGASTSQGPLYVAGLVLVRELIAWGCNARPTKAAGCGPAGGEFACRETRTSGSGSATHSSGRRPRQAENMYGKIN